MVPRTHASRQIFFHGFSIERLQGKVMSDAILELAHLWQSQLVFKFGLAKQDNLKQLVTGRFQIVQQSVPLQALPQGYAPHPSSNTTCLTVSMFLGQRTLQFFYRNRGHARR